MEEIFLDMHFALGDYYFGAAPSSDENYKVKTDIVFKKGKDYELKYDVYYPKDKDLLGADTKIINIHGGAWTIGDKGNPILKYYAALGYYIYDIQYRLNDANPIKGITGVDINPSRDEDVVGDFTIEDIIKDVANFTIYLHSNNHYGANLNNVFFMGDSAGGHLAAISTFAYNEGIWGFSPWLNITGGIFVFPPNDAEEFFYEWNFLYENGIMPNDETPDEDPEFYRKYTPSEHIDDNDPPCIIFHGTSDILKDFFI